MNRVRGHEKIGLSGGDERAGTALSRFPNCPVQTASEVMSCKARKSKKSALKLLSG
jgi:hypothetical protein